MFGKKEGQGPLPVRVGTDQDDCLLDVKDLIATSVFDTDGRYVGRIEDIVIDARSGCIRHAVLVVGGILGIGGTRMAVMWRALTPDANARRCIVDRRLMQFTAVPVARRAASRLGGIAHRMLPSRGRDRPGMS